MYLKVGNGGTFEIKQGSRSSIRGRISTIRSRLPDIHCLVCFEPCVSTYFSPHWRTAIVGFERSSTYRDVTVDIYVASSISFCRLHAHGS